MSDDAQPITDDMIACWRTNYGLDKLSPADAAHWWEDKFRGLAPAGAVAALGLALGEIDRLRAALLRCARQAEALKRDCGMEPESAQALRNAQYQSISTTAHIALGTIQGPQA